MQHYPAILVINAYGPTEASDDVTHHIMTRPVTTSDVPIGLDNIFAHQTIHQLAALIDSQSLGGSSSSVTSLGGPGEYVVAPVQESLLDIEGRSLPQQRATFNRNDQFMIADPLDHALLR